MSIWAPCEVARGKRKSIDFRFKCRVKFQRLSFELKVDWAQVFSPGSLPNPGSNDSKGRQPYRDEENRAGRQMAELLMDLAEVGQWNLQWAVGQWEVTWLTPQNPKRPFYFLLSGFIDCRFLTFMLIYLYVNLSVWKIISIHSGSFIV